jgi:sodium/hydrogen antiporter
MGAPAVVLLLTVILGWSLLSGWSTRHSITGPIAFLVVGYVAVGVLDLVDVPIEREAVKVLTEVTLTLVLFSDASRVNLRVLARSGGVPVRLLGLALPLTVLAGWLTARALLPGLDNLWLPLVIAAALAPTDAALGAAIVTDRRVPLEIRRTLNVESGLNDGMITPVVLFALAGLSEAEGGEVTLASAAVDLLGGAALGLALGAAGAVLLLRSRRRSWCDSEGEKVAVLALALLCYAAAEFGGVNGFIGAFVGGMAYGTFRGNGSGGEEHVAVSEDLGHLFSLLIWFLLGAVFLPILDDAFRWQYLLYAALSLTVLRMAPVALALLGRGLGWRTIAILGWFGPRGLATVLFGLLAAESLDATDERAVVPVLALTVVLSVIAHGVSAGPLAGWYARHPDPKVRVTGPEVRVRRIGAHLGRPAK